MASVVLAEKGLRERWKGSSFWWVGEEGADSER